MALRRGDKFARETKDSSRLPGAPQPGMKSNHCPLAETHQSELALVQSMAGELGVKKSIKNRLRLVHTDPAFIRVGDGQMKPLASPWRMGARLGRVRRDKRRSRQQVAPLLADRDQIVAVCAISVQKDNELLCHSRFWGKAWPIDHDRHTIFYPSPGFCPAEKSLFRARVKITREQRGQGVSRSSTAEMTSLPCGW